MRAVAIAEAVYLAVAAVVFAVLYAARSAWRTSMTGRNLMAFMVGFAALLVFLVLSLIHPVPYWVFALILGELCYAATERVWLLWRAQQKERS